MGMTSSKDVNNLIREAELQGWVVQLKRSSHLKWTHPLGHLFFSSSTPSDHRVLQNIKNDLRMNGFVEVHRKQGRKK